VKIQLEDEGKINIVDEAGQPVPTRIRKLFLDQNQE